MTTDRARPITKSRSHGEVISVPGPGTAVTPGSKAGSGTSLGGPYEVGELESGGVRLYYEIHGHGPKVVVYLHGILLDANLNRRLATDLAAEGYRVILLDLPGHGRSEKPRRASYHRMDIYARHVVDLLDHLDIDSAVIGGVSLGAGVALMVAAQSPERVQGLIIEMPVLEWAVPAAALTFVPLLLAVHAARPLVRVGADLVRRLPRTGIGSVDSIMNTFSSHPQEIAAVLHGILAGPITPTVEERAAMTMPTLIIGHGSDRIHPFHDAEQLARRMPNARLVRATSLLELRAHPQRLTEEIAALIDEAWEPETPLQDEAV